MTHGIFSEGFVEADGFRIRYMRAGAGEPLVCLHGAGGPRVSAALDALTGKFDVIAFEMPGFGESAVNDRTATAQDMARTMSSAVEALGIKQYNILGNSFGAKIALYVAIDRPETIRTVVLLSPAAIRSTPRTFEGEPTPELLYAHPDRHKITPPAAEIVSKQRALVQRLSGPPRDEAFEAQLRGLTVPMLVLFGTRDRITPPENGRIYRALMPKSNLVFIYDAAHAIDADRPEAVVEVVADYINRHDSFLVTQANGMIHP